MAPTIPTTEPTTLVTETTWKWNPAPAQYPAADGWSLSYRLVGQTTIEIAATNTGSAFEVVVGKAKTQIPAGTYTLTGFAELAGERYQVNRTTVTVIDSGLSAQKGEDRRAWCEKTLEIVEAVLTGKVSSDVAEYSIAGRSVKSLSMTELWALRASLRQELYTLRTGKRSQPMRVRFGRG